ncbi:TIGR04372 family glycosyltransferase [Labrys okinawensis]|uniref:TIGR04372 family glycosyltransferase n=1 Tax=Labrys okinawensis TaxID=346911 RepID=UPI0039BD498B
MKKRSVEKAFKRSVRRAIFALTYGLLAFILSLARYRFVVITIPGRIGHLAIELDWFLKQQVLGQYTAIRPIVLLPYSEAANPALLRVWGNYLTLISNPIAITVLKPLVRLESLRIDLHSVACTLDEAAQYQDVVKSWGDRPPLFKLPESLNEKGRKALEELGMPPGGWFVCIHARDGVYSPGDEHLHIYRNSDIANCLAAVDAIIARGGWCIRMGERGTASLPDRPGLINYPDTHLKSDWMDLYLASHARFFLGNTSGLCLIATISGVPCALANMAPYGACYGMGSKDISIPKRLKRLDGSDARLAEIFASDVSSFRFAEQYRQAGWVVEENTEEQIRELVLEMLDRLDGVFRETSAAEHLQQAFRRLLTPRHYTYGTTSRIGEAFLSQYAAELGMPEAPQTVTSIGTPNCEIETSNEMIITASTKGIGSQ